MFLSMWNYITEEKRVDPKPDFGTVAGAVGFVQPYLDSPLDDEAVGRTVFLNIIGRARRYVW